MPRTTAVIPVRNGEPFIRRAIDSVLAQTDRDTEIIVVDDGSTDGTERAVHERLPAVRYERQEACGVAAARNLGVSLGRGDWIAFLDADDAWYPRKLEVQFEALRSRPETALVYSDLDAVDEAGNVVLRNALGRHWGRRRERRGLLEVAVFGELPFPYPSTVLVRKDAFERAGGFDPAFPNNLHEDFEAFSRIFPLASPHFIPQALVRYVSRPWEWTPEWSRNWSLVLERLQILWKGDREKQAVLTREYALHFSREGKHRLRRGEWAEARRSLRRSLEHSPWSHRAWARLVLAFLPGARDLYARRKRIRSGDGRPKRRSGPPSRDDARGSPCVR